MCRYLFMRIRDLLPKQVMTPMHMLALVGRNGIGRLGYSMPNQTQVPTPKTLSKSELLQTAYSPELFDELVAAYLSTGAGIAGLQPKIMVRNGDAHLKNFGLLYRSEQDIWLAPMFDVVTTSIYRYARSPGGPLLEDRTLALKLFAGRHQGRAYPTLQELLDFGSKVCGVARPAHVLERIAQAMRKTMSNAKGDSRIPKNLLTQMELAWESGLAYASA